jgi:hypothetical protein
VECGVSGWSVAAHGGRVWVECGVRVPCSHW